jgi:hypothetical protein
MQARLRWCLWWGLAESAFGGSLEACGRFCVGAFGRNLSSIAVNMFSHLIYFIKKFSKFCTFSAICKGNVAIIVLLFGTESFILVNFDGSYSWRVCCVIAHLKHHPYFWNSSKVNV